MAWLSWTAVVAAIVYGVRGPEGPRMGLLRLSIYFTTWSNLTTALAMTLLMRRARPAPAFLTGQAAVVSLTMLYLYFTVLTFSGFLHETLLKQFIHIVPMLMIAYWVLRPAAGARYWHALVWPLIPIAYLAHVIAVDVATGIYPYAELNPRSIGLRAVTLRGAKVAVVIALVGLAMVSIDRWRASLRPRVWPRV